MAGERSFHSGRKIRITPNASYQDRYRMEYDERLAGGNGRLGGMRPRRSPRRVRNMAGKYFIADARNSMKSKNNALLQAASWRKKGATVRTISTADGYLNYIGGAAKRQYNYRTIPYRTFEDSMFGIDSVRLTNWLKEQPEYNNNLDWKVNLQVIGGPQALDTLQSLMNPEQARTNAVAQAEAENNIISGWDAAMIEQGIVNQNTGEAYTGGGARSLQDVDAMAADKDIYSMLGLLDDTSGVDDNKQIELDKMLKTWFDEGVSEFGANAQEATKIARNIKEDVREMAVAERNSKMGATALDRELNDMFSDIFADETFGDEGSITLPNGQVIFRPDRESDLMPSLGAAQPGMDMIPDAIGGKGGTWTYRPHHMGGYLDGYGNKETKDAWIVADSIGTVLSAWPYTDGETKAEKDEQYEAVRQAFDYAKNYSELDPFNSETYTNFNNLSPGIAVIDGYVTYTVNGEWLGWDIKHTDEDYRLQDGNFRYFLDGEAMVHAPSKYTSNWVLPRFNPHNPDNASKRDPLRERLESLMGEEGEQMAQQNAKIAQAEMAKRKGASASDILDIMEGNRYQVSGRNGPITAYMADWKTALKEVSALKPNDVGSENLYITVSPSTPEGKTISDEAKLHAEIIWSYDQNKWLIDYTEMF